MDQVFPFANVVAGVLVLLVGFGFHFCGQLISITSWDLAVKWGLQEPGKRPEYYVYEHGIAVADVLLGWTYPIVGVGLIIDAAWSYTWAWLPGVVLTYHALSFWFWTRNQLERGDDDPSTENPFRSVWTLANLASGVLAIIVASSATS